MTRGNTITPKIFYHQIISLGYIQIIKKKGPVFNSRKINHAYMSYRIVYRNFVYPSASLIFSFT